MDQNARAAFIVSQAACMNAVLASMQAQNVQDTLAGRPLSFSPQDFENLPDVYGLGHNTVITYLQDY